MYIDHHLQHDEIDAGVSHNLRLLGHCVPEVFERRMTRPSNEIPPATRTSSACLFARASCKLNGSLVVLHKLIANTCLRQRMLRCTKRVGDDDLCAKADVVLMNPRTMSG